MATIKPPPQREKDFNSPVWQQWFNSLRSVVATSVDSPTVDNFASLTSGGNIQDSGYDSSSFSLATHVHTYLGGDGTAGRKLRQIQFTVADGTNANTLKCTVASLWNGDAIGETDNVAKNATTGDFTLNLAGTVLTISTGLTGNVVMAQGMIASNSTATAMTLDLKASGNNIVLSVRNAATGVVQDITGLVGVGAGFEFYILYITSS